MAAQTAANGSTVTMPTALVFLVSNFSNFVTIKLDAHNYMLWKNQVRNALSANGYLGFIDGTTAMPCPEILDSSQNKVPNPEYVKWMMINGHLLACITATVSPSIQTHLLGLEHVYEVWTTLSNRFSSLSRSHVHDLRQRLFNITKTSTMQEYLDEITDYAQKLAASGSPIDEEDLIFYALNGLPSAFDPIKSAARMRGGELKFEELTSILEAEDMILQKAQSKSGSKPDNTAILVATQTSGVQGTVISTHGNGMSSQSASSNPQNLGYHTAQTIPSQQPYYNSYQSNRNRGNGRGRGYKGSQGQQWNTGGCQICFRTNHTAATCYYRQNLGYQPFQFQGPQAPSYGQSQFQQRPAFSVSGPPPQQGFSLPYGSSQYQVIPQPIGQSSYQGFSQSGGAQSYGFSQPQRFPQAHFTQNMTSFGTPMMQGSTSAVTPPGSSWFFDSGATSHVTNELSNLSTPQPYTGGTGVMVGNGNTLPIAHFGSSYEPSASQGSMSPGSLSHLSLY